MKIKPWRSWFECPHCNRHTANTKGNFGDESLPASLRALQTPGKIWSESCWHEELHVAKMRTSKSEEINIVSALWARTVKFFCFEGVATRGPCHPLMFTMLIHP